MSSGINEVDEYPNDDVRLETVEQPVSEIARLRNDLEECRTHLFALLKEDDHVSEGTIEKEYKGIAGAIEVWVDEIFGEDAGFRHILERNLRDGKTMRQMEKAGLDPESPHFEHIYKASTCNLLIPSRLIWRYLYEEIFCQIYPIGLLEQHYLTVRDAETMMEKMNSGEYGILRIDRWRSEALTALTASDDFRNSQKEISERLTHGLHEALRKWIVRGRPDADWSNLHEKVISKSVMLQHILSCSFRRYRIVHPPIEPRTVDKAPANFEYKRLETLNRVSPKNVEAVMQLLSPSLTRLGRRGKTQVTLVKAVIIACTPSTLTQDSPERHTAQRTFKAIDRVEGSDSGGLLQEASPGKNLANSRGQSSSYERLRRTRPGIKSVQRSEILLRDEEQSFRIMKSSTFPLVAQLPNHDYELSRGHESENEAPLKSSSKPFAEATNRIMYIPNPLDPSKVDSATNTLAYTRSPPRGRLE